MIQSSTINLRIELDTVFTDVLGDLMDPDVLHQAQTDLMSSITQHLRQIDNPAYGRFAVSSDQLKQVLQHDTKDNPALPAGFLTQVRVTPIDDKSDPATEPLIQGLARVLAVALAYVIQHDSARVEQLSFELARLAHQHLTETTETGHTPGRAPDQQTQSSDPDKSLTHRLLPHLVEAIGEEGVIAWNLAYRCAKDARLYLRIDDRNHHTE